MFTPAVEKNHDLPLLGESVMASGMDPTGHTVPAGSSVRPVGRRRGPASSEAAAGFETGD
ncbi:MAG: hypothetical protein C0497_04755 [Gemmatimonas sp.]|nr:hypothetical protein [Gemmatimonas sp.]